MKLKNETSTSSTYVSLVFYCIVKFGKNICQKIISSLFLEGIVLSGFAPKYPWIFRG
jgi:hypothetical protein